MNSPTPVGSSFGPARIRFFMAIAWLVILIKCVLVSWAVDHWRMPFHAGWIIVPTVTFALLATVLWVAHREG